MTRRLFLLPVLCLVAALAMMADDMRFVHLTVKDGLSHNQINSIFRDSQGFMWFATRHGLCRYDGYEFRTFLRNADKPGSIPFNYVSRIGESADSMMWLGFENRMSCSYDPRKETFADASATLEARYGLKADARRIYTDRRRDLWVECDSGRLWHYSFADRKGRMTECRRGFTAAAPDRTGMMLLYADGTMDHISADNGSRDFSIKVPAGMDCSDCFVYCDRDGDYWLYGKDGARIYSSDKRRWIEPDPALFPEPGKARVRDVASDADGRVWLAVENSGVYIVDKSRRSVRHIRHDAAEPRSLTHDGTTCLYVDPDGGVWTGTFKRGVSYYNKNMFRFRADKFHMLNGLPNFDPDVSSIAEDSAGNLLVGVADKLVRVDRDSKAREVVGPGSAGGETAGDNVIIYMMTASDGTVWLSTYKMGLLSYDGHSFRHHVLDPERPASPANRQVWATAEDANGYIWIGTWGAGLYGLNPATGRVTAYRAAGGTHGGEQITSVCAAGDGHIYMGTTYGLLTYDPANDIFHKMLGNRKGDKRFGNQQISQVFEDSRGLLWISTGEGLDIYDRRNDDVLEPVAELGKSIVNGVAEDLDKNIWVSCTDGVYHIVVNGGPRAGSYSFALKKYDDVGLSDNLALNQRAIMRHSSGTIVLGGVGGINLITPAELKDDTTTPRVRITGVQLFNRDVDIDSVYDGRRILDAAPSYTDRIELNYGQNMFSVSFSAMNYLYPEKVRYMYRLDGFDSDWVETRTNRITYTNLAPGEYDLRIKAVNDDGYAGDDSALLRVVVHPPLWRTWPAYLVYLLILAGLALLVRALMRRSERQKYMLMQVRQEALRKHEMDDMKLRFFTNISHDLRTPLTLILTPLEYAIARIDSPDLKGKLEIARNNALRLLSMVNQLLDFRKSEKSGHNLNLSNGDIVGTVRTICDNFSMYSEHKNISLTFFSAEKKLYMLFDEDKVTKIVMNLLSNAFKFTPEGGRVDVSVSVDHTPGGDMLEIRVADNGCGISDEHKKRIFERFYQVPRGDARQSTGSGVGLNLVKEFVDLHEGSIRVADNAERGAVFIVALPVRREEAPAEEPDTAAPDSHEGEAADSRPTLLIVDDNDDFRMFMKDCLRADYNVHEAADGAKAWEMIPALQPDIVVSDVMMPEMNGNELCRKIKNDIRTSHILVILLTARTAREHEIKGFESGADDYITKPFNISILTYRIANLLQRRKDAQKRHMDVSPSRIAITPLDEKLIRKAIKYVEDNMGRSELSVEELSGELAMSRVHFYKKLVSITGKTPTEFIRIIRLKRAAQLLAESQLGIAEIAYQTGFNSLSLFRKYFKNEFGVLPSEYQARHAK